MPLLLTGGIAIAFLSHSAGNPPPQLNVTGLPDVETTPEPASYEPPLDAEQKLQRSLQQAASDDSRAGVLEAFQSEPGARSTNQVLRSTMVADSSPRVRTKAFEVAMALALREDREALIAILHEGVRNPYPEVRRESLRACRDHPQFDLMSELIEVVKQGGHDRSIAVEALAFLDDPEAQRVVLETAQSDTIPRTERIQAIVLLSETELDDSVRYLQLLATGEDTELQAYAIEALSIWQRRNKR